MIRVMKTVRMPCGEVVPALGQGTWTMGEDPALRAQEIASLRAGLDRGLRLIDTAEMYGEGLTESLVGEAIAGRRDEVFLVSKVYPHNASLKAMRQACANSLKRLKTDRIDLYLLHWRGSVPLEETLAAFAQLQSAGHIRNWGVSNLDTSEMQELWNLPGGGQVQTDQILYNLTRRGPEWDLLPWSREHQVPVMAYSPIEQGRLLRHPALRAVAERRGATPAQVALAWILAQNPWIVPIPGTTKLHRLEENIAAADLELTADDLQEIETAEAQITAAGARYADAQERMIDR
jgi:diketogulonate reductase-like aldo/keto reductase